MEKTFSYKIGLLFNYPTIFVGILLIICFLALISVYPIAALVLLVTGLGLITGRYGVQIDVGKKKYREYISLFGFIRGKWVSYDSLEKIFINSGTESQTIYSRTNQGYTMRNQVFRSFLKFDDGNKIALFKHKNKSVLRSKVDDMAQDLSIVVQDNSE